MRRHLTIAIGLFVGLMLALSMATVAVAQKETPKKQGKAAVKQDRIDGTIQSIDKKTKTVTVRLRGKPMQREVIYDDSTKFTFRNKSASLDELKEGRRVICLGKYDDKTRLMATRIDVRDKM